jgi:GT2 family glycosyltransferase
LTPLTPDISVVIVSYNVLDYLKPCLVSVYAQVGVVPQVMVVDNNSTDGTVEFIRGNYPQIRLIENKFNNGFSGANNQGLKEATGEYLLLLNPDTEILEKNTLSQLKEFARHNNQYAMLAPRLLNTDGSLQASFWPLPGISELLLELFYIHRLKKVQEHVTGVEVGAVSGAVMFCSRALLLEVDGLDEKMFWMEDTDLCYRLQRAGNKILYLPDIKVVHHGGKSSGNYSVVIPNQVLSKLKFSSKHGSYFQYVIINVLTLLFICSRLAIFTLLSLTGRNEWAKKRNAYGVAFNAYFNYVFSGNNEIIK